MKASGFVDVMFNGEARQLPGQLVLMLFASAVTGGGTGGGV